MNYPKIKNKRHTSLRVMATLLNKSDWGIRSTLNVLNVGHKHC
ncbi:hypothetical protein HDEF_0521 [Candidatus Hamiltonella defensa 5AT (Acyrthosiphon pisum)]|uniref:Uncharacterized protein n=1 Tax=Hamiltonella defensa subsp. Acyrthosiphon pisum (strain 5AT) TaxID=572265 RepID=C4K3Y2_HAMD5|nr:hypothetical protein HDEF_0521 [Candidatus Hamiltonella defensa 5AT (Acyrthosiphon pisum)]